MHMVKISIITKCFGALLMGQFQIMFEYLNTAAPPCGLLKKYISMVRGIKAVLHCKEFFSF